MQDKMDHKTELDLQERETFGTPKRAQHRKGVLSFDGNQKLALFKLS